MERIVSASDPFASLPPLPEATELSLAPLEEEEGHEFTLKSADPARSKRLAWSWAVGCLAVGGGISLVLWLGLREYEWNWVGLVGLFVGFIGAATFAQIPPMVDKHHATIVLTRDTLRITDAHMETSMTLDFPRASVRSVWAGHTGKRELLFDEGRTEPGFFGVRWGEKAQLYILLEHQQQYQVLTGWEPVDLQWLAGTIEHEWGLTRRVMTTPDVERTQVNLEKVHDSAQALRQVGPLVIALLAGCGLFLLYIGFDGLWGGWQSRYWQPVPGTVHAAAYIVKGKGNDRSYSAKAQYEYVIHGVAYTGDTVSFTWQAGHDKVRHIVEPLKPGGLVTVYVDPADPTRSVLVPGISPVKWFFLGAGLLDLLFVLWLWRRRRRMKANLAQFLGVTAQAQP